MIVRGGRSLMTHLISEKNNLIKTQNVWAIYMRGVKNGFLAKMQYVVQVETWEDGALDK